MADGHIYTLDFSPIKHLEHKALDEDDTDEQHELTMKLSADYYINEDAKPITCRMIANIDDILRILKTYEVADGDDKQVVHLVHQDNDFITLITELRNVGYSPGIRFDCGRIVGLVLEFNKVVFNIKSQQLITGAIDGDIAVDNEQVYNNMNVAMLEFGNKIFKPFHKSYYTNLDIDILDEYRTLPIVGKLMEVQTGLVEIDISKAYTSALAEINQIPIFNEFGQFRPYHDQPIKPFNLYLVKNKDHALINKSHSLLYGKFLKDHSEILAVKEPSFIKDVDYKTVVDELYTSVISEDPTEDIYIKKLIANVNIGLLEKGLNKKTKAYLFHDLTECKHFQAQLGGTIHMIQKIADVSSIVDDPFGLDFGIQSTSLVYRYEEVGAPFYVLALKAERKLENGFRYIKELLLQIHNDKLYSSFDILKDNDISIYSVKTDCFVIKSQDLDKAKSLLNFDNGLGSWRLSKTSDINIPSSYINITNCVTIPIDDLTTTQLQVNDEYDTSEICQLFEQHKRVMVRADLPGSGKSYACKSMERLGHKVLFVVPTNKLAQNNKDNGVTLNQFFGVGMSSDQKMAKFDDSDYDTIVLMKFMLLTFECWHEFKNTPNHQEKLSSRLATHHN